MSTVIIKEGVSKELKTLLRGYYDVDYYTTADIELFMGDTKIDDVISLEYSIVNNKTPIYGAFSRYYDAVAKGNIIIKGSIGIVFKRTNYLSYLYSKHMDTTPYKLVLSPQKDNEEIVYELIKNYKDYKTAYEYFDQGLKTFMNALFNGDFETVKSIYNAERFKAVANNKRLEIYDAILKDYFWGGGIFKTLAGKENKIGVDEELTYKKRADELDTVVEGVAYGMEYSYIIPGFEIYITYGYNDRFRMTKTMKVINDVHIISEAQSLQVVDEPVVEIYEFFARNIDHT